MADWKTCLKPILALWLVGALPLLGCGDEATFDEAPPAADAADVVPAKATGGAGAGDLRWVDRTMDRITVVERMTYGVAVGDVDGDGDLDLFYANFGTALDDEPQADQLWLNRRADLGIALFDDASEQLPDLPARAARRAVMADLDGDGDLDIVVGNSTVDVQGPADNRILLNDGRGHFTDASQRLPASARGGLTCAVDLIDFDGDGDLDIFFGQYGVDFVGEQNNLLRNEGGLRFSDVTRWLPDEARATADAAFGDVDGDGDLDFVTAEMDGANVLYVNRGGGRFMTARALPGGIARSHSIALADFDRDGALDIVVGNLDRPDVLLLGDGRGGFAEGPRLPQRVGPTTDYGVADVDEDGDLDLFVAKGDSRPDGVLLNRGDATFTDQTDEPTTVRYMGGQSRNPARYTEREKAVRTRVFGNGGVPHDTYTHQVVMADVDDDGLPDAVTAMGQIDVGETSRIFGNHRGATGRAGWFIFNPDSRLLRTTWAAVYYGMAVADLDQDGDDDVLVSGRDSRIMINEGGELVDRKTAWLGNKHFTGGEAVRIIDVNGDRWPDVVSGGWAPSADTYPNRIWLNDRGQRLVQHTDLLPAPGTLNNTDNFSVGDVDGDGDDDILECNIALPWNNDDPTSMRNRLLINEGGVFVDRSDWLPDDARGDSTFAAEFGDLDGDGDLDIVYANNSLHNIRQPDGRERVLINQGGRQGGREGMFRTLAGGMPTVDDDSEDLALGDLDGDGDLDLVVANQGPAAQQPSRIYFNDGHGRMREIAGRFPLSVTRRDHGHKEVELGDLDGDGDLDIVLVDQVDEPVVYLENNGRGVFSEWGDADGGFLSYAGDAELLDIDQDGDLDLYVGATDYKISRVLFNETTRGDTGGGGDGGGGDGGGGGQWTRPQARVIVRHAYLGILGRTVDPAGLETRTERIYAGGTILELCTALWSSREFDRRRAPLGADALARDLWQGVLQRKPGPAGLAATIADIDQGQGAQRAAALLSSAEFARKFLP